MKKLLLIVFICVLNSSLFAKTIESYRCIPTSGNGFFMFNSNEFPNLTSVMYYPYLKPIKVKHVRKNAIATDEGRPYIFEQSYVEYSKGKSTGTYLIETQGALINSVLYTSNKGTKKEFEPDYNIDYKNINNELKKKNIYCE